MNKRQEEKLSPEWAKPSNKGSMKEKII